jgi:DNA transformation protein and related proteins
LRADPVHIAELFAAFGPVSVRRMFSGAGVFRDGVMIALVSRDTIYFKADAQSIPAFEREGLGPFAYKTKGGERTIPSFWRMPERLYDDPDELADWARQAHAAALRAKRPTRGAARAKRKRRPEGPPNKPIRSRKK